MSDFSRGPFWCLVALHMFSVTVRGFLACYVRLVPLHGFQYFFYRWKSWKELKKVKSDHISPKNNNNCAWEPFSLLHRSSHELPSLSRCPSEARRTWRHHSKQTNSANRVFLHIKKRTSFTWWVMNIYYIIINELLLYTKDHSAHFFAIVCLVYAFSWSDVFVYLLNSS